jgi:putative methyltransferase (TIGR04325 family)
MRYEAYFAQAEGVQLYRGVYRDFEEARAAAPRTKPLGYDHPGPASLYRDRMERPEARDYPVLFWLREELLNGARSVFDLGGHVGVKFSSYRRHLDYPPDLRWTVCDVEAVVTEGRAVQQDPRIAFMTQVGEMDGVDVLLALGSLQYLEPRLGDVLASLRNPPRAIILNGLPLHRSVDIVTLQSIGVAYCPYRVFGRERLAGEIEANGYRLADEWGCPGKSCLIPFHVAESVEEYTGLYFRRI